MSECLDWHSLAKQYADPCIQITNASEQIQVSTSFQADSFGCLCVSWHSLYPSQMCSDLIFNRPMEEILEHGWTVCINCRAWSKIKSFLPLVHKLSTQALSASTENGNRVCSFTLSLPESSAVDVTVQVAGELDILPSTLLNHIKLFKTLFDPIDAFELSRNSTTFDVEDEDHLTYGEIEVLPFLALMSSVRDLFPPNPIFCDLGCGSGRAVIAMALAENHFKFNFRRFIGIELLPTLCKAAHAVHQKMISSCGKVVGDRKCSPVEYYQSDFLENDNWTCANVIYIASLCFDANLMSKLYQKATALQADSVVLTLERFPAEATKHFTMLRCEEMVMSWGVCEVFVYIRNSV
uniref:Histone-lysine N-methyltransferase, H3 lysine-79 specific n=2 Tax=Guillardia theta TaxID=55529 RepID=A0A7S4PFH9_GUITH|mmetsp:Transcript_49769/g.155742  ORF Transcript_49769/g.155742 Transcript_49769/m.155742 type:complete len:351 (+) Transcript_49769:254-1306(+)